MLPKYMISHLASVYLEYTGGRCSITEIVRARLMAMFWILKGFGPLIFQGSKKRGFEY